MRVEQMLPIVDPDPKWRMRTIKQPSDLETSREEILDQLLPQFAEE